MTPRAFFLFLAACLLAPITGRALDLVTATDFVLPTNSALEVQTALYASDAQVDGEALDDIFVFAQAIRIPGQTMEDAWLGGGSIHVSGTIGGHLRAIAQSVNIQGTVNQDITALASAFQIATNGIVEGRIDAMAEQASLEGQFHGDVRLIASSVTISGTYGGDVRVIGQDIVVMPGTRIAGNLTYTSPKELFLDRSVVLGGELVRAKAKSSEATTWRDTLQALGMQAAKAVSAFLVGLALIGLFPRYTRHAAQHLHRSVLRCAAIGSGVFLAIPVAALLLVITLVGIPLALILLAAYGILLYSGKVIVALIAGTLILRSHGAKNFAELSRILMVGLIAFYVISFIPAFGGTAGLLIGIVGMGALISALIKGNERPRLPGAPSGQSAGESNLDTRVSN